MSEPTPQDLTEEEKIPANIEDEPTPNREPQPETPSSSIQTQPLHCFAGPETCEECRKAQEEETRRIDEEKRQAEKILQEAQRSRQNVELEAQNASVESEKKIVEQERTRIKKAVFLEALAKTMGENGKACDMAEITRETYHDWCRKYPEFKEAVRQVKADALEDVEDIAIKLVRRGHPSMVRWWLERNTEKFKPHTVMEVIPGNAIVFEDMNQTHEDETDNKQQIPVALPGEET